MDINVQQRLSKPIQMKNNYDFFLDNLNLIDYIMAKHIQMR